MTAMGRKTVQADRRFDDRYDAHPMPIEQVMRIFVNKPGFLLNRIDQIANVIYGTCAAGGETLAQAEMLLAIAQGERMDQVGLARACGIDTSTAAVIIANLEVTGLITREQDPLDRRRSLPLITVAGGARLPAVRKAFAQLQEELLDGVPPASRDMLIDLLAQIARTGNGMAPPWTMEGSLFEATPSMLFRRALQISHAQYSARVAPLTITLRQFSALLILHLHPGMCQVEFARAYGLDPSTCAVVLKNLKARGLLMTERAAEDRRKTLYFVTDQGREDAAVLQRLAEQSEEEMMSSLPNDTVLRLLPHLHAVAKAQSHRLRYPGCLTWDEAG